MSSIWKASFGSPSRSWRITQAVIVFGSSPGSTSSWLTFFTSACAKTAYLRLGGVRDRPLML